MLQNSDNSKLAELALSLLRGEISVMEYAQAVQAENGSDGARTMSP